MTHNIGSNFIDGKYMKRGVEAHMVLYLSLSRRYYEDLLKQHPRIHIRLKDALEKFNTENSLKDLYTDYLSKIVDSGLFHCIELHDQSLTQQAKFLGTT